MSSTNKTANYQLSQFVGTDIPSILNDYNGDMRKIDSAIHDASVAGGDNASAIAELQSSTARMNTEIGGINSTVNTLSGKVVGVEEVIPATASADNKLLTAQELPEIPSIAGLEQDVADLQEEVSDMGGDVKAIQLCVPANASQNNKFATMEDISSSAFISEEDWDNCVQAIDNIESRNAKVLFRKTPDDTFETALQTAIDNLRATMSSVNYQAIQQAFIHLIIVYDGIVLRCSNATSGGNSYQFTGVNGTGGGIEAYDLRFSLESASGNVSSIQMYHTVLETTGITRTSVSTSTLDTSYSDFYKDCTGDYITWH